MKIRHKDLLIKLWVYLSLALVVLAVAWLLGFLVFRGIGEVNLGFLLDNPKGMPLGTEGGIRNAILGSFALMGLAMVFSTLLGVSCAIFNVLYCRSRTLQALISLTIQCISSIPSILIGMFVYGFFIVTLHIPSSLLTAGIALGMMVFSFVEIKTEKAIREVEAQHLRDSEALGAGRTYMIRRLVLPTIRPHIVSNAILAGSYAIGATAPLLMTGVVYMADAPSSLLKPVMALPFHLHMLLGQAVKVEKAYATALVLLGILFVLHFAAELVMRGLGGWIVTHLRSKKS